MVFLKKLAFWKHEPEESVQLPPSEPEPAFPSRFSPAENPVSEPSFPSAFAPQPQISQPSLQNYDAELRVISAKLDTIKAMLDVVNQRLERLEGRKPDELKWR